MKRYIIKVAGQSYTGLFDSSCSAVIDAMERFPGAAISARAAP